MKQSVRRRVNTLPITREIAHPVISLQDEHHLARYLEIALHSQLTLFAQVVCLPFLYFSTSSDLWRRPPQFVFFRLGIRPFPCPASRGKPESWRFIAILICLFGFVPGLAVVSNRKRFKRICYRQPAGSSGCLLNWHPLVNRRKLDHHLVTQQKADT